MNKLLSLSKTLFYLNLFTEQSFSGKLSCLTKRNALITQQLFGTDNKVLSGNKILILMLVAQTNVHNTLSALCTSKKFFFVAYIHVHVRNK
jgi:hypothetical protein